MSACLSGLAGFLIFDVGSPANLTTGNVVYWLENSVGNLNTLLGTCYRINDSGCFEPPLNAAATGIFNEMYKIKYYDSQASNNLGASAYAVTEVREGDSVARFINKNEVAKTYIQLSKDARDNLKGLITLYRTNAATPRSVVTKVLNYYNAYYGPYGYTNGVPGVYRVNDTPPKCC